MFKNQESDFGEEVLFLLFALLLALVLSITLDNDHRGIEERGLEAGIKIDPPKAHLNSDAAEHRDTNKLTTR